MLKTGGSRKKALQPSSESRETHQMPMPEVEAVVVVVVVVAVAKRKKGRCLNLNKAFGQILGSTSCDAYMICCAIL